jgi:hypothetical protein
MVKINTSFAEWWSGPTSADRQRQNTTDRRRWLSTRLNPPRGYVSRSSNRHFRKEHVNLIATFKKPKKIEENYTILWFLQVGFFLVISLRKYTLI